MSDIKDKLDMRVSKEVKDLYIKTRGNKKNDAFLKELLESYNGLEPFMEVKNQERYLYSIAQKKYITSFEEVKYFNLNNFILIKILREDLENSKYKIVARKAKFENRYMKQTYMQEVEFNSLTLSYNNEYKNMSFDSIAEQLKKWKTEIIVNAAMNIDGTFKYDKREKFEDIETVFGSQAIDTVSYLEEVKEILKITNDDVMSLIQPVDPY